MTVTYLPATKSQQESLETRAWHSLARKYLLEQTKQLDQSHTNLRAASNAALNIAELCADIVLGYKPHSPIEDDLYQILDSLGCCLDDLNDPETLADHVADYFDCLLGWSRKAVRIKMTREQRRLFNVALRRRATFYCAVDPDLNPLRLYKWLHLVHDAMLAARPSHVTSPMQEIRSAFENAWSAGDPSGFELTSESLLPPPRLRLRPRFHDPITGRTFAFEVFRFNDLSVPLERCIRSIEPERERHQRLLLRQANAAAAPTPDEELQALLKERIEWVENAIACESQRNAEVRRSRFHAVNAHVG